MGLKLEQGLVTLAMAAAATGAAAQDSGLLRGCKAQSITGLIGSYHVGNRYYNDDDTGAKRHYNESNPGFNATIDCPKLPRYLSRVFAGHITANSYGRSTTFIGVENTLSENTLHKSTLLAGVFPTGYLKPRPLLGLTIEGKGPFAVQTGYGELRPYGIIFPGDGHTKAILAAGIKLSF